MGQTLGHFLCWEERHAYSAMLSTQGPPSVTTLRASLSSLPTLRPHWAIPTLPYSRLAHKGGLGERTCPGSGAGTSGGRQSGRAVEVGATCSSKLLMRGFLVGSGLASGVTLLRLMSGVGPFLAS